MLFGTLEQILCKKIYYLNSHLRIGQTIRAIVNTFAYIKIQKNDLGGRESGDTNEGLIKTYVMRYTLKHIFSKDKLIPNLVVKLANMKVRKFWTAVCERD